MTKTEASKSAAQVAAEFAALKKGRIAEYVGGGWLSVRNAAQTGSLCGYRVRLGEARAAIARAAIKGGAA